MFSAFSPPASGGEKLFVPNDTSCVEGLSLFQLGFNCRQGFALYPGRIPTGFCNKAQGREGRATLRNGAKSSLTPTGLRRFGSEWGCGKKPRVSQRSLADSATLGLCNRIPSGFFKCSTRPVGKRDECIQSFWCVVFMAG